MTWYYFKSIDSNGYPCKTMVGRRENGDTFIMQRGFIEPEYKDSYKVLRKWKGMYYCENYVGLQPDSLGEVMTIIANKL